MNVEYRNGSKIRYTPTNDYVFKKIFGKRGNEDITANLLKAITGKEYEKLNLEDLPLKELAEDFSFTNEIELPISKKIIKLKY